MAFQSPSTVPSFSTNREQEDSYWRQKKHAADGRPSSPSKISSSYAYPRSQPTSFQPSNEYAVPNGSSQTPGGLRSKLGGLLGSFTESDLPMYKDKPHYPSGTKGGFINRLFPSGRRRRWAGLGVVVLTLFWWSGLFSSSQNHANAGDASALAPAKQSWWQWFNHQEIDWRIRRHMVKQAFIASWDDYAKHAWGTDIYSPISGQGRMMVTPDGQSLPGTAGIGWIIIDGLDTAIMMNLTEQVAQARKWISTSLDWTQLNGEVSTFETTIRVLGGLLSAHYLSSTFPTLAAQKDDDRGAKYEDLYIEKAVDLAERLLGAFNTESGVPLASINLNTTQGIKSIDVGGASSTAEAATLQLELKYVAKLTGEPMFWQRAEKVIEVMEANKMEGGLVPIYINPSSGKFQGSNIRLGSRGDSYYEYLIKQFLQTGSREMVYSDMWEEALEGMKKHLVTFSKHGNFTVLGELEYGIGQQLSGKMDHLVCFLPGTIALGVTGGQTVAEAKKRMGSKWGRKQEEDLILAEELMKTCYGMYAVTKSGLAPEITFMVIDDEPRRWVSREEDPNWKQPRSMVDFVGDDHKSHASSSWKDDFDIHPNDVHNLQRPETLESLFYMWRITRDEKYREWGWEIFIAFQKHTQVYDRSGKIRAYTSISDVTKVQDRRNELIGVPTLVGDHLLHARDSMEGFWLAETLKYLYLLFSDEKMIQDEWFDISKVVINTEAHFLPRFDIEGSKVFKTGWSRKPRAADQDHEKASEQTPEKVPEKAPEKAPEKLPEKASEHQVEIDADKIMEEAAAALVAEMQDHAQHIDANHIHARK